VNCLGERRRKGYEITRVLLVEDHAAFREALASFLNQEEDLEVVAQVGSLAEGRRISADEIDVALIDVYLPDGVGIELVRELRQVEPRLGILALTGSLDLDSEVLAKEAGADEVLYKAAGVAEIAATIRHVVERRAS
jgi:DNA-binding NarL/FixJ family response regulator